MLDKLKLRFRKWVAKRLNLKIVKPRARSDGDEAPSEHFRAAVFTGSGLRVTCSSCRRCFFRSWGDYEPGELEELRECAKREPDRYFEVEDFTQCGDIDNKQIPLFCPCNGLRRYEDFIWDHRELIAQYLADRAKSMRVAASLEVLSAAKVARSVRPIPTTEDELPWSVTWPQKGFYICRRTDDDGQQRPLPCEVNGDDMNMLYSVGSYKREWAEGTFEFLGPILLTELLGVPAL